MSYRPPEEQYNDQIDDLLDALSVSKIREIEDIYIRREESGSYGQTHLIKFRNIISLLRQLRYELREL